MRNLIIALLALAFASCEKSELRPIEKPTKGITYKVECDQCLVYFEDTQYNRTNKLERSKNQHIVVTGQWEYDFAPESLEYAYMRVVVGVFAVDQPIKASISVDGELKSGFDGKLGSRPGSFTDYRTEEVLEVAL